MASESHPTGAKEPIEQIVIESDPIKTTAEIRGFRVREHAPGIMGVEIGGADERVFSMDYHPRTTMALRQLMDAMRIEMRADGANDLSRWRGAFNIQEIATDV